MTYLPNLHAYLHQSSLLIQAYPDTRITTKYSLPRQSSKPASSKPSAPATTDSSTAQKEKEKREPSATLTLKTFHPGSGICLKYRTDKAQEVGRLMLGLGRLAKGEVVEMPAASAGAAGGDKMDLDEPEVTSTPVPASTPAASTSQQASTGGTGGGKNKKKKSKK